MSYTENSSLLPASVYKKDADSNNAKFWKLFAGQLDELENAQLFWYDRNQQSGVQLDRIGKLKGIYREGLSDDDYRYELSLPRSVQIITLPALYEFLSTYGTDPRIQELFEPYLFEKVNLDAERILDASWPLDPAEVPVVIQKLDSGWLLDGTEPLEAFGVRSLGLLAQVTVFSDANFNLIFREMKRLLAAVSLYLAIAVIIETDVFSSLNLSVLLDASKDLDGSWTLNTEIEAVFFSGVSEVYRTDASVYPDRVEWASLRRKASCTLIQLVRSGEVLFEKPLSFNTSIFEQYRFILRQKT